MPSKKPILVLSSYEIDYSKAVEIQTTAEKGGTYAIIAGRCFRPERFVESAEYRLRRHEVSEVWVYGESPLPHDVRHLCVFANRHQIAVTAKSPGINMNELL
jgi:hypothetical protein